MTVIETGEGVTEYMLRVEVETTGEVNAATERLSELGLFTQVENDTSCCYALQDKVWTHGPDAEPWEVYTVKADAPQASVIHTLDELESSVCGCGTPAADGEKLSARC